jgi:hypothetical protein
VDAMPLEHGRGAVGAELVDKQQLIPAATRLDQIQHDPSDSAFFGGFLVFFWCNPVQTANHSSTGNKNHLVGVDGLGFRVKVLLLYKPLNPRP